MSTNLEGIEQYNKALKNGQKYQKTAIQQGRDPYPAVLDKLLEQYEVVGNVDIGIVNIPSELIVGTRSAGRTAALAGNFMPLLGTDTEFATKWIRLCLAHSEEGIRDPIQAFEFLGKFYVQEGNKRVSVLKSYDAPTISGTVTRVLPALTEDPEVKQYYEFLKFYNLAGIYGLRFDRPGGYARLQAALGVTEDHVWTEDERRSFQSGYTRFRSAYEKMKVQPATPAEALLVWLQVFSFQDIKNMSLNQLVDNIATLWPDMKTQNEEESAIAIQPDLAQKDAGLVAKIKDAVGQKDQSLVSKLKEAVGQTEPYRVAFIYGFAPETSVWTQAHEMGRQSLSQALGDKVEAVSYIVKERDYFAAMEAAVEDGAKLIFATTPPMIDACRKVAALHKNVRVFNCAFSQPYTGVTMYYSRNYECRFLTGAIAGTMAENDRVGYIASYPIFGEPASINAFALGVRMANPRAKVELMWSSTCYDCVKVFREKGIQVISNRDAASLEHNRWNTEWGTYRLLPGGEIQTLAMPCWNWGAIYEKIVRSAMKKTLDDGPVDKAVNYWFGMDSGVLDVQLSASLPDGVKSLALMLKKGIVDGTVDPFRSKMYDQNGVLRNNGETGLNPQTLMEMNWLLDNVEGTIPAFEELLPPSREMVRLLGLYRDDLSPVTEEKQL